MNRYWLCIVGAVDDTNVPENADLKPRLAVRNAIIDLTGEDPKCSSGWIGQDEYMRIQRALYPSLTDKEILED
jgi:hypothetical protein